jgi:Kef-type K+ transport system membrane component KefB
LLAASNPEVKEKVAKGFESTLASILLGILFLVIGMEMNLKAAEGSIILLTVLLVVVVGAKLVGVLIAGHRADESSSDRLLITIGILPQGEMGILIAAYLFSRGLVDPSSFNWAVIVVVVLTMITPIVMMVGQIRSNIHVNVAPSFTGVKKDIVSVLPDHYRNKSSAGL